MSVRRTLLVVSEDDDFGIAVVNSLSCVLSDVGWAIDVAARRRTGSGPEPSAYLVAAPARDAELVRQRAGELRRTGRPVAVFLQEVDDWDLALHLVQHQDVAEVIPVLFHKRADGTSAMIFGPEYDRMSSFVATLEGEPSYAARHLRPLLAERPTKWVLLHDRPMQPGDLDLLVIEEVFRRFGLPAPEPVPTWEVDDRTPQDFVARSVGVVHMRHSWPSLEALHARGHLRAYTGVAEAPGITGYLRTLRQFEAAMPGPDGEGRLLLIPVQRGMPTMPKLLAHYDTITRYYGTRTALAVQLARLLL